MKMVAAAIVAPALSILLASTAGAAEPTPEQTVSNALVALQSHIDVANRAMGEDGAQSLGSRLVDDITALDDPTVGEGWTQADWDERLRNVAVLDASIVDQVLSGKREPLGSVRGLAERLIVSKTDGTWQPIAIYVPRKLGPDPSLVVLLHGRPQTESDVLGGPFFQELADSTNTIVAAPWGRGNYDFYGVASDDVYQTADEVAAAYSVDAKHIYLAGYSMGGFSVFKIGPTHGAEWHAVLCIAGVILNSETASVLKAWRSTPIYVVNGKLDQNIPPLYGEMTSQWLASVGIPTGFYQEPTGTHYIPTLMPSLSAAWHDMLSGVVHNTPAASSEIPPMGGADDSQIDSPPTRPPR